MKDRNNKHHKYFRNKRYKEKLDHRFGSGWYCYIRYITEEPDPKFFREEFTDLVRHSNYYRYLQILPNINGVYNYWSRPEVKYSVIEVYRKKSSWTKGSEKASNRTVRQKLKNSDELFNYGLYKKIRTLYY